MSLKHIRMELETGIDLKKCRRCGCMQETLVNLSTALPMIRQPVTDHLAADVMSWRSRMDSIKYNCLGCDHCYPAVAQNELVDLFPAINGELGLACDFQPNPGAWPPVGGEYFIIDGHAPVAVTTLGSVTLAKSLAHCQTAGLAIVGKTETENIGIDKIIKNVITNPALQYLVVAGVDTKGHRTGDTLLALAKNGADAAGRVIDSPGKRPVLRNVSRAEIEAFRAQITMIDMVGCESVLAIEQQISQLVETATPTEKIIAKSESSCSDVSCSCNSASTFVSPTPPVIKATLAGQSDGVQLDKAGYFVILPLPERGLINVEHYNYDHTLQRIIEGETARAIYKTIVANRWVSSLSHAAYLGRELTRAEFTLSHGIDYVQDGA